MGKKAFLIGAKTTGLTYTNNDVSMLSSVLSKHNYEIITNSNDKNSIIQEFDRFIDNITSTDTLLFYFSGHAYCPKGNLKLVIESDLSKASSQIPLNVFLDLIDFSKAKEKLVILDCCRAGVAIKDWNPSQSDSYRMLLASDRLEEGKELDSLEASFLTYYLCQALSNNIPEIIIDNKIRINDIYSWLKKKTEDHNYKKDSIKVPIPNLLGNIRENFVLADVEISKIVQTTEEPSISIEERIIWIHDYYLPKTFIGRDTYLREVNEIIKLKRDSCNTKTNFVCITGIGGSGKSCLARKIIEDIRYDGLPYKYIIWFSFAEAKRESKTFFYDSILKKIDGDYSKFIKEKQELQKKEKEGDIIITDKLLKDRLCDVIDKTPILLIIDNIEVIQNTLQDISSSAYGSFKSDFKQLELFLKHIINSENSLIIATSRSSINKLNNVLGFKEFKLDSMEPKEGAELLTSLGVRGENTDLEKLSNTLGNHALCLKSAGIYIAKRNFTPSMFKETYLSKAFETSAEGAKMLEILNLYRELLTKEQEFFLMMASIHLRNVTRNNLPALVKNYIESEEFIEYIEENIIQPLVEFGLMDKIIDNEYQISYSIHPLMKFAYESWFNSPISEAYAILADAAKSDAERLNFQRNIDDLQPYFDSIYFYIKANGFNEAYEIIINQFETFARFRTFETTNKYLKELEKAYDNQQFSPSDELVFFDQLSYTSKDEEERVYYRKINLAKSIKNKDCRSLEVAGLLCDRYLDYGYLKETNIIIKKYFNDKPVSDSLLGRINYVKGNYSIAQNYLDKEYKVKYGHDKCRVAQKLCSLLIASKNYSRAEEVVKEALDLAFENGYNCCVLPLYDNLITLELEKGNISIANKYYEEKNNYGNLRGMDIEEHDLLLLYKSSYDEVIDACVNNISSSNNKKYNRVEEIHSLILMAKAYKEKGMLTKVDKHSTSAKKLIKEYGLYKDNWLIEKWKL